ncbi:TPA: Phosphorylase b kinase gamma catalytic chain, liver/testis isoform [Trebouxia sp. C0005]
MMDSRQHGSHFDHTIGTLYKMAGGATGTTLGLVSGYRKPVLTKQQRLQQEFEAPWLRLLRSFSVDVEDLAGAEAALEFLQRRLDRLDSDARVSKQQSEAHQTALDAAETENNAVKQQLIQLQQNFEAWRADVESKLTTQVAALQALLRNETAAKQAALASLDQQQHASMAHQAAFDCERKAKEEAHTAVAAAEEAAACDKAALAELSAANRKLHEALIASQGEKQAAVARLESERKANEAVLADEQKGKEEAQAALALQSLANQKLQKALSASQKERQAAVAQLASERKAIEAVLAEEQKDKKEAQAQLASERKAHKVFLADEQKGKKVVQASLQNAQEGAKRISAAKCALEQEVKRMAQSALAREAKLKQDSSTATESLKAALTEAKTAKQTAVANFLAESNARSRDQVEHAERVLKLGSVMDKKDDHVASLQHMVVYYRDRCGMTPKQGSVYDAPDPDEEYPLQDPMFVMGEEVPSDEQDHYMELARQCVDNRWDPINAWDRWLPQLPLVESLGEGLRRPANNNEWLPFPQIEFARPRVMYGEPVGRGAQGVVFPGRRGKSQTTSIAIKVFENTPKALFDQEWSQLVAAQALNTNVVRLIRDMHPLWDSSARRGYMFLKFAQGGDLEGWLVKARESAGIGFPPCAHECIPYTPPQQAQVVSMIRDLFQGLRHLHSLNIVHNDVKPHNCLLQHQDNFLKLADLANSVRLETGLPGAQFEVAPEGTEAYMAPERLAVWSPEMCLPQKGRKYTAQEVFAGDVWAGGITAFKLLLGRPYTLPTCSPACFYLEGDAQQMTRALQRHKRGLCQQDVLLQHVTQVWGRDAMDLLAATLHYEPAERCTAAQALSLPFLAQTNLE